MLWDVNESFYVCVKYTWIGRLWPSPKCSLCPISRWILKLWFLSEKWSCLYMGVYSFATRRASYRAVQLTTLPHGLQKHLRLPSGNLQHIWLGQYLYVKQKNDMYKSPKEHLKVIEPPELRILLCEGRARAWTWRSGDLGLPPWKRFRNHRWTHRAKLTARVMRWEMMMLIIINVIMHFVCDNLLNAI